MTFWKKWIYFYYIYGLGLHSVRSIKENYFIIIMHLDRVLSSFERMIFRRLFVCLSLCLSVGTYVRGECSESTETAGVVAPWGRPSSQRNSRMAQHAELDLQAPSPVLPQKGLLQEEPAKIGAALNITSWFTEITVSPLFILFSLIHFLLFIYHFSADSNEWKKKTVTF